MNIKPAFYNFLHLQKKGKIYTKPIFYIWCLIFIFLVFFVFNFNGIADFRDSRFLLKPDNFSFANSFYTNNYWTHQLFRLWTEFNLDIPLFWAFFYSAIFSSGWVLSFIFLKKIVSLLFCSYISNIDLRKILDNQKPDLDQIKTEFSKLYQSKFVYNLSLFFISGIYIFNPYILERFFMGHYYILLGHSLFMLNLYLVLSWFIHSKSGKGFWKVFLGLVLAQFSSTHHGLFLLYFLSLFILILFLTSFLKDLEQLFKPDLTTKYTEFKLISNQEKPKNQGKKESKKSIYQIFYKNIFNSTNFYFLLTSAFVGLMFLSNYIFREGFNRVSFYFENIAGSQNQTQIIEAFSLQTLTNSLSEHLVLATLGLGGWMSPFLEIQQIQQRLGIFSELTLQYSIFLQVLVFSLIVIFLINFIYTFYHDFSSIKILTSKPDFKNQNVLVSILEKVNFFQRKLGSDLVLAMIFLSLVFSWFLNFGYSNAFFTFINSFFYNYIPGFYTYREPGKFYSFFIAFLVILIGLKIILSNFKDFLGLNNQYQPSQRLDFLKWYKTKHRNNILTNCFFGLLFFSNFLPFLFVSNYMNYVTYPKIFSKIDDYCQQSESTNSLFLPFEIYLRPSYSPRIFTGTPANFYFQNCNFVRLNKVTVQDGQTGEVLSLNETKASQRLDAIISRLLQGEVSNQEFNQELELFLAENQINNILIETFNNPELEIVNKSLQKTRQPKFNQDTIYWYTGE